MHTDALHTGDVVLFYNRQSWLSWTIALFDRSTCSHVGLVLRDPPFDGVPPGVYLLESGYEPFPDVEDHASSIYGVRLSKLDDVIRAYGAHTIRARRLLATPTPITPALVCKVHAAVHGKPYDLCVTHWAMFAMGLHGERTEKTFQCAAMVTYVLMLLGLVNPDADWTFTTPGEYGCRFAELPLRDNVVYGALTPELVPSPE